MSAPCVKGWQRVAAAAPGVVHHQRHLTFTANFGDGGYVGYGAAGVGDGLEPDRRRFVA